jgi:hypothetical protein
MPGNAADRGWRVVWAVVALVALGLAGGAAAQSAPALLAPWTGAPGQAPGPPWAYAGLPAQKPPPTRFVLRELEGGPALEIEAERAYGNLVHPLASVPAGMLRWRWRLEQPLPAADLRRKDGDDAALKVCALFELPRGQVPFVERQLLRLAESRVGTPLPTATLCYVWDSTWPRGSVVPNAYTRRVRFITLGGPTGRWLDEQQDLAADFLRAFGDEAQAVPPLSAVLVGADADNTGGRSLGWIAALRLEPANPPPPPPAPIIKP